MNPPLRPEDRRPARLNALPKLPIFLDLAKRSILVVGGSDGIAWKVELLAAAGGTIRILADDPSPELLAVVRNNPERLSLIHREWGETDLVGVSVASRGYRGTAGGRILCCDSTPTRCSRQHRRSACLLRLPVRHHRQSRSCHRIHIDRWGSPRSRPSHPPAH